MSEFHDQIAQYRAAIEAFLQARFCQDLPQSAYLMLCATACLQEASVSARF